MDIIFFSKYLKQNKNIKLVQLNPSLYPVPVIRDSFYLILSKFYKKKIICFFHGWGKDYEKKLIKSYIKKRIFRNIYNKSDLFYVLAEEFKSFLIKIGINKKINITKTTFDGDKYLLLGKKDGLLKMVYVGRFERDKGVFTILNAVNELKNENLIFTISFIGWFPDKNIEKEFKDMIDSLNLKKYIDIKGYVPDEENIEDLINSDIFIYPTYYPEGCPTVVIEALAAGLFVITTDTAALKEVIKDKINGIIVKKDDYIDLASNLKWCLNNKQKINELGEKNKKYAFDNFESKVVIENLYSQYKRLLSDEQ